jgi:transposase
MWYNRKGLSMNHYKKTERLSDANFKQIIGVKRETFAAMVEALTVEYQKKHKYGGRPSKLTIEEQLLLTLKYLRQYVTQKELAYEFEVGEATVHDTIVWVENTLVTDEQFILPGKKALLEDESIEVILVDVTECPIERPKKNNGSGIQGRRKGTR